jgi:hypothetical protein
VACDHRGLRTAVVKQDFPSRAVSQVLPARSAATALAVSFIDPELTPSVHRSTSERAVPEGTTHNPWKPAVRGNQYAYSIT